MGQIIADARVIFEECRMDQYRKNKYFEDMYLDGTISADQLRELRGLVHTNKV